MYETDLPSSIKLLQADARVSKVGSLMFLLLGPKNYQKCPQGFKRIGWIALTVVPTIMKCDLCMYITNMQRRSPNNELSALLRVRTYRLSATKGIFTP